jgi:hypothetical protein
MDRQINNLEDIIYKFVDWSPEYFTQAPKAIILYGSFLYQDLRQRAADFESLDGQYGFLDKKPDCIMVVSDVEKAIRSIGSYKGWENKKVEAILSYPKDTPFYFNLLTNENFTFDLKQGKVEAKIPYKVGIVSENSLRKVSDMSKESIMLACRLTKPYSVVFAEQDTKDIIDQQTNLVREYFVGLSLEILPKRFTGEQFTEKYLQSTYLCEAYRVFDLVKKKHLGILASDVYDIKKHKVEPMIDRLEHILSPKLMFKEGIRLCRDETSFLGKQYYNSNKKHTLRTVHALAVYSFTSFLGAIGKHRMTNKLGGADNIQYLARKFMANCPHYQEHYPLK